MSARHGRTTALVKALVSVAFGATYGPTVYRELPGALRAALHADRGPLLRLTAEALYGGSGGAPRDYSEGLDAAVSCHDYPQLYDMTAPPATRQVQYAASVRAQQRSDSQLYAPFTIGEYLASDWELADWCLQWPVSPAAHPAGPPGPPTGSYPDVPTLVLSGELDSITTAAEGAQVAAQFPAARQVVVANSFHVTAMGDTDDCAVRVVRRFVVNPRGGLTASRLACVNQVPPVRAVARYDRSFQQTPPARGTAASRLGLRAAAAAVGTAADLVDRWFGNYTGHGFGLRGGGWSYSGDRVVRFRLRGVRLTRDLPVSGRVTWSRYTHRVRADLNLGGSVAGVTGGTVHATWDSRRAGGRATIRGFIGGSAVAATMPAP